MRVVIGDGLEWEAEIEKEFATPFDAARAAGQGGFVASSEGSIFILVAHHSIADGKSLVFAIRDILRAFRKSLDPLPQFLR